MARPDTPNDSSGDEDNRFPYNEDIKPRGLFYSFLNFPLWKIHSLKFPLLENLEFVMFKNLKCRRREFGHIASPQ